jgi:hypothetical protein
MKGSRIVIGVLCLLLAVQVMLAIGGTAKAGVWCTDLALCTGNAGCRGDASIDGCVLTCTDGSKVLCIVGELE